MLVLSRKRNETVVITVPPMQTTRTIVVSIAEIRGDKVRLGIAADKMISVNRPDAINKEGHKDGT